MNWTLEVVCMPVTDVDRARDFYTGRVGFNVDFDSASSAESRVCQLTPPGSGCSIQVGVGITDIRAARAALAGRGVNISEVQVYGEGGLRPARAGDALDNVGFCYFADPDGNGRAVQQIRARA